MNSPFTIGSTSPHGSGTVPNPATSYALAVEGQGTLTFRDDAPLLSLLDPATRVMSPTVGTTSTGGVSFGQKE